MQQTGCCSSEVAQHRRPLVCCHHAPHCQRHTPCTAVCAACRRQPFGCSGHHTRVRWQCCGYSQASLLATGRADVGPGRQAGRRAAGRCLGARQAGAHACMQELSSVCACMHACVLAGVQVRMRATCRQAGRCTRAEAARCPARRSLVAERHCT
jgi:hypothetical protein